MAAINAAAAYPRGLRDLLFPGGQLLGLPPHKSLGSDERSVLR